MLVCKHIFKTTIFIPFEDSLSRGEALISFDEVRSVIEVKMAEAIANADSGAIPNAHPFGGSYADEWYPYIQGHLSQAWESDVARMELMLRAFHQWGEGGVPGFTTFEEFCDFNFAQIISCDPWDENNFNPDHIGANIAELGFPQAIYDKLNESNNVNAHPTEAPPAGDWWQVADPPLLSDVELEHGECLMNEQLNLIEDYYLIHGFSTGKN